VWKGVKALGNVAILGGLLAAAVHFVKYGRKHIEPESSARDGSVEGDA
jgi:hypothetical protein